MVPLIFERRFDIENSGYVLKTRDWIVMDLQEFEIFRKNIFGETKEIKWMNGGDFERGSFLF